MIIFFNEFCRKRKKKGLGNFCTRNKLKKAVMIFKKQNSEKLQKTLLYHYWLTQMRSFCICFLNY